VQTAEHPDFAGPVNFTTDYLSDWPDAQVAGTVSMMRRYALDDSRHPAVVGKALEAGNVQGVFNVAQRDMYFQRDERTAGPLDPNAVEVLVRPCDVAVMSSSAFSGDRAQKVPGDCDCFSMYVASMLLAQGVPCAFVTTSADGKNPDHFSHVYVVAWPNDKERRVVIDASHGKRVGWEAPNHGRYKEWPLDGVEEGAGSALVGLLLVIALYLVARKRA